MELVQGDVNAWTAACMVGGAATIPGRHLIVQVWCIHVVAELGTSAFSVSTEFTVSTGKRVVPPERNAIGHTHVHFKRAGVGTTSILECKIGSNTEHNASSTVHPAIVIAQGAVL
jgi:hypothetical protein